jgi:hypothetical protein
MNELNQRLDNQRYQNQCIDAIMNAQRDIWEYQKGKVEAMSSDEKLSWLPKWAEYLAQHAMRTDYDKDSLLFIKMPFDLFIAANTDPDQYLIKESMHWPPCPITKGYITYVI